MLKLIALILMVAAAAFGSGPAATPEIDPATGISAVALLAGAVLIVRARRRK